jgi:L-asparagine transporter-like permease
MLMHNFRQVTITLEGGNVEVQVNVLAVVLAAAASMAVGSLWYSKSIFGGIWGKLVDLTNNEQRKGAAQALIVAAISSLITAYVLAYITFMANRYLSTTYEYWMTDTLQVAFWLWLGVSATTTVLHNAFEQRRARLTFLTVGYQFVSFLVMATIIGLFRP